MIGRVASLADGYVLLERFEAQAALAFFRQAASADPTPEAFEGLGMAASLADDSVTVFEARERAYELYRARSDLRGAARLALWLMIDAATFRGEIALANGWLQRARTLLAGVEESSEHGWLALGEAEKALLVENDGEAAHGHAERAVAIARRTHDTGLEAHALALQGIAAVTSGLIPQGMANLDEAATACMAGDVREPWVISSVLCYMMDACDRVRDWDRAVEWFNHVSDFAMRWNNTEFYAQCRPHYAVVLTWRGAWADAEVQLSRSIDELGGARKPMAVEGIVRLAELRWRQGRMAEATSLFEQVKHEPLAQIGIATLALDAADAERSFELVERCLRRLPRNDRLERLPALELYVRACVATGDCDRAVQALPELDEIASVVSTRPVQATISLAKGMVAAATGDLTEAHQQLEDAVDVFDATSAPFETARARLELARVLVRLDRSEEAAAQAQLALDALVGLGAAHEAQRAREIIRQQLDTGDAASPGTGLTQREREVLRLLATGMSNQEIADQLVLSIRTVQRHVENIYAKTGAHGRAAAGVFAASHGLI